MLVTRFRWVLLVVLAVPMLMAQADVRGARPDVAPVLPDVGPVYGASYAVVIGIDAYPKGSGCAPLDYAVGDARAMADVLEARFEFEEVIVLLDKNAGRDSILEAFESVRRRAHESDSVFVFWAAHGVTEHLKRGDFGYLVPYDGTCDAPDRYYSDNIPMESLRTNLSRRIPAKHQLFVLDACYAGLVASTRSAEPTAVGYSDEYLAAITREDAAQIITAGSAAEAVLDVGPDGHSVFASWMLRRLASTSEYVTAIDLYVEVRDRVYNDAQTYAHTQSPQYQRYFGNGDYVFVLKEKFRASGAPSVSHRSPKALLVGGEGRFEATVRSPRAECTARLVYRLGSEWLEAAFVEPESGPTWSATLPIPAGLHPELAYYVEVECGGHVAKVGGRDEPLLVPVL